MSGSRVSGHFIESVKGPIFVLLRMPAGTATGCVLVVPPFAEEMNKCRRMIAELAAATADRGVAVVVPDLYGTGDSGGNFADADWATWEQDLGCVCAWCEGRGLEIRALLAVRFGVTLAVSALQRGKLPALTTSVFWQPVLDGGRHLGQFLRLRVAAGRMAEDRRESVPELFAKLHQGESLEIAGYRLAGTLAARMKELSAPPHLPEGLGHVYWIDVVRQAEDATRSPSRGLIDHLVAAGSRISFSAGVGEPFWSSTEIVVNVELVSTTSNWLTSLLPSAERAGVAGAVSVSEMAQVINWPSSIERPIRFEVGPDQLVGIVHEPVGDSCGIGVVFVVGGPQYRVGSHRQFVVMARSLAAAGHTVLRFDHRGMGDSDGAARNFEAIDTDIRSAIGALETEVPSLNGIVVFGLCDAASAALIHVAQDSRVRGLVLANPWIRSVRSEARTVVRHYYAKRFLQPSFWRKFASGEVAIAGSLWDALRVWWTAARPSSGCAVRESRDFRARMRAGLATTHAPVLLLISEDDLTASEFMDVCRADAVWSAALARANVTVVRLSNADHTFSSEPALSDACRAIVDWLRTLRLQRTG